MQASLEAEPSRSLLKDAFSRLLANKGAVVGMAIILLLFFVAFFGPYITPYDFLSQDLTIRNQKAPWAHPFGTDDLGRDVLSRIIYGARRGHPRCHHLISFIIGTIVGSLALMSVTSMRSSSDHRPTMSIRRFCWSSSTPPLKPPLIRWMEECT